jgi:lipoprotein-releasing system ATP-binding protein|tara:strand:- start:380 stop:1036 length:657 start_codon:yes stop_codon:yes gene_type:complete
MLKGKNIYKSFDNLEVLKDINIEIERGKIVSIVGKSGAGKSTLLYILSTLDKATNGEVLFDNKKLDELKGDDLSNFRNKKIGFIFQFHNLLSEFTVLENVSIPALISSSDKEKIKIKAKEILKKLNLFDRLAHKPNELSGGEQQRVAIARSLINSPDIVFADEPTGNLDSENSQNFIKMIQKLNKEYNQTFVIVTHNKDFFKISDYSYTIKDGRIKLN